MSRAYFSILMLSAKTVIPSGVELSPSFGAQLWRARFFDKLGMTVEGRSE
jgi:hypothetical protein